MYLLATMASHIGSSSSVALLFFLVMEYHALSQASPAGSGPRACDQNWRDKTADCSSRQLADVPQDLYPDLIELDMSDNMLTVLRNASFRRYTQLIILHLTDNFISRIEREAFYPLRILDTLIFSGNNDIILHDDIFRFSTELRYLSFVRNGMISFPNETLTFLPKLETLILGVNNASSLHLTACHKLTKLSLLYIFMNNFRKLVPDTFSIGCQIDHLILSENPIEVIAPDTIAALPVRRLSITESPLSPATLESLFLGVSRSTIEELDVTYANITHITADTFRPLRNKRLSKMSLEGNRLIPRPSIFTHLTRVYDLNLDGNNLEIIEPEYFNGMKELRILSLYFNFMRFFNPYNSVWEIDLHKLNLSVNALIGDTPPSMFAGMNNLSHLDMSYLNSMSFEFAFLTFFIDLPNLLSLNVTSCRIRRLNLNTHKLVTLISDEIDGFSPYFPGKTFKNATMLKELYLSDAKLVSWDVWNLNKSLFMGLNNLITLDLSHNGLYYIFREIFADLSSLQTLDLSSNLIKFIEPDAFRGLVALQKLNLGRNQLQDIPHDFFIGLDSLKNFNVHSNGLSYLDKDLFANSPMLTKLSLANNSLVGFNDTTFYPLSSTLLSLDLSGNPLVCNCEMKWLVESLNGILLRENDTICSSALDTMETLRGEPLTFFKTDKLCVINTIPFSVPILAVTSLLYIILIVYSNRWLLKYKIFLLKLSMLRKWNVENVKEQDDFDYLINIMFTDADEEWARDHLRPEMEQRLANVERLSYGDEALMLNMYYLDAVNDIIARSFKTLLVVSRAAVQDNMFMTKFRIAMNHVSDTETENIILIFLEDVPDEELPYLVRLYLSGHRAYVRWTEDQEGQEYFWNELLKRLNVDNEN